MARRVKSSKEKSIEEDIRALGAEKTQLTEKHNADIAALDAKHRAALAELDRLIAEKRKALEQAKEDDFND